MRSKRLMEKVNTRMTIANRVIMDSSSKRRSAASMALCALHNMMQFFFAYLNLFYTSRASRYSEVEVMVRRHANSETNANTVHVVLIEGARDHTDMLLTS